MQNLNVLWGRELYWWLKLSSGTHRPAPGAMVSNPRTTEGPWAYWGYRSKSESVLNNHSARQARSVPCWEHIVCSQDETNVQTNLAALSRIYSAHCIQVSTTSRSCLAIIFNISLCPHYQYMFSPMQYGHRYHQMGSYSYSLTLPLFVLMLFLIAIMVHLYLIFNHALGLS